MSNLFCSFCLDTKRTKKVKADEKRLKLFERNRRKKNSSRLAAHHRCDLRDSNSFLLFIYAFSSFYTPFFAGRLKAYKFTKLIKTLENFAFNATPLWDIEYS